MSDELTLIIAIVGLLCSIISIIVFVTGRQEKGKKEGVEFGEIESNIEYIKNAQTNVLVGQREISTKLDKVNEQTIRLEEKYKSLDKRVTKLEQKGDKS